MRFQAYKSFAFAFLFLALFLGPAASRADEKTNENAGKKPEAKSDKKAEGPFTFGKRWDTHSYIELDVLFDRYRGAFKQEMRGDPVGVRLRRGGDWKYVAFHFDLAGGYAGSLKSSKSSATKISNGNLGFANMNLRLNGVLPVLYGVMLQGGIINETWGEFAEYETPAQKEANIYIVNGIGPNIMLSFCPIKYISLNFEYSAILKPLVNKHMYGSYAKNDDFTADDYSVSSASFSTVEVGVSARPLKYLSIGLTYGEKKMSHWVKTQPQKTKFSGANYYTSLYLSFTY